MSSTTLPESNPTNEELARLERSVHAIYDDVLSPLAKPFLFDLPKQPKEVTGMPSVLFLGNHSSGKSSFINHLLETEAQKTGVAPTDDGFTILSYSDTEDELDGQSVATHSGLSYRSLERFGPQFLSRLRLKTMPHPLLRSLNLIDSPGMIDAAGTAHTRGYDFSGSVRYFAETADLILFFFDPDKPGTTGETVSIFTETLEGLEYKLYIIMNKVDLFPNIRDFARTYGTLCWNLSKTIQTKDIPHIFNIYLPNPMQHSPSTHPGEVPLQDFDNSRKEVISAIYRAPTRRADNLVTELYNRARKLSMLTRVSHRLVQNYRAVRNRFWAGTAAILAVTAVLVWATWGAASWLVPAGVALGGLLVAALTQLIGRYYLRQLQAASTSSEGLDKLFNEAYRIELGLQERADLHSMWSQVKKQIDKTVQVVGFSRLPYSYTSRKWLKRVERVLEEDIPRLRRQIARPKADSTQAGGRDAGDAGKS